MIYPLESANIVVRWGFDEVVKRISCRVVRSVPFSRSVGLSQRARGRDAERSGSGYADVASVGFESPSNSVTYTFGPGGARVSVDEGPAGRILDFYV